MFSILSLSQVEFSISYIMCDTVIAWIQKQMWEPAISSVKLDIKDTDKNVKQHLSSHKKIFWQVY